MKNRKFIIPTLILVLFLVWLVGCRKGENTVKRDTVTDTEGNIYLTVKIGTQTWMAENLRTTKYNDGSPIPKITGGYSWNFLTTPAYCWYNNDSTKYARTYGALYNWYTIETGKLCPTGWHVPTLDEWDSLQQYLITHGYGYPNSDDIAKSLAATSGWKEEPTTGAVGNDQESNNSTGFSALPGGIRIRSLGTTVGEFEVIGEDGYWWLSTEVPPSLVVGAYNITIYSSSTSLIDGSAHPVYGMSVRCMKDSVN